ncbi:TPA: class I SAM-dependent methyltransferase [Legionella pneumophila]
MNKGSRKLVFPTLFAILLVFIGLWIFRPNPWNHYFHKKINDPPRDFIVKGLQNIPSPSSAEVGIDLGAGVGHETYLLLQKGYNVIAIDNQKAAFDIMLKRPQIIPYKDRLTTYEASFENIDFQKLPSADIVIASFALPFCKPDQFNQFWHKVSHQIKPGGYFIGNTFDPGFTAFKGSARRSMTFHTKAETMNLFKDFNILKFKEVKKPAVQKELFDHYYEVIAIKK